MPNATPNGWPYILPTDNVADYPVTSQGLATKAEAAVPFAYALFQFSMSVGASASYDRAVNFPAGLFTIPPVIFLSKGNSAAAKFVPSAISSAVTGFTCRAQTADGSTGGSAVSLVVNVLAVQYSSTSFVTPGVTFAAQEMDLSQEDDPEGMAALIAEILEAESLLAATEMEQS